MIIWRFRAIFFWIDFPVSGLKFLTMTNVSLTLTLSFVQTYKTKGARQTMTRNPNMREAILGAAEILFSTKGFNAVSIRDIALEAGANPGSVTYHFKSKDGLL